MTATYDIPPIHGRGSYIADLKILNLNAEVDLSGETIYLEIPSAKVRVLLPVDPVDPNLKRISFTRTQVEQLPTTPSAYCIVDESDPQYPVVLMTGTICRYGFVGAPA